MGHSKQVECFSHARSVGSRFKQPKRLLMGLKPLLGSSCVHQPVAQTIQAAGMQRGISKLFGQVAGTAEPSSCPFVITSCPEEAECHHTLPFHQAIMSGAGCL